MTVYSRIAGTGSYLPEKVLTNADLEKMRRHQRRVDRQRAPASASATSRPRARPPATWPMHAARARWKPPGVDAAEHRPDHRRHHHARPHLPVHRLPAAASARRQRLPGVRRQRRLLRLHLRAERRRQVHPHRRGQERAGGRRRDADPDDRLDRSQHLRAVRRRRRRGGAQGRRRSRHPVARTCTPTAARRNCCTTRSACRSGFKPDEPNAGVQSA